MAKCDFRVQKTDISMSPVSQGDPTYLVVNDQGKLENFGINAVCTHLGCVVPWVGVSKMFMMPCWGSRQVLMQVTLMMHRLRTSSSAPATDPSITPRARLSAGPLPW